MSVFSRFLQLQNGAPRTVDLATNTLAALGLQLNGSSSGNLSQFAAASTSSYSIFWPAAQGEASSFLQNDGSGNLSWGSVASSPSISSNFIAGENFAANKSFVVRWAMDSLDEDTDEIFKADYDSTNEDDFWVIGIAHSPTFRSAGQSITVYSFGAYTLGSSDTPFDAADIGKPVWLTGVGTFSTIAPTGDAQADFKVGIVIGTDRIWLDGQMMGIGNSSGGGVPVFPTSIAEGGTGQNNKTDAFDALSPMSALGDIIVGGASGTGVALAVGGEGQILSVVSGIPAWIDFSPTPSLTQHHILVGNASNVATDVAMSGEATIVSTGAVTLSNAAVIAKVLTGFTSGAGSVSASDSILSAIQKLDGNIAGKQASGNYITALTGEVSASGPGSASATVSNAAVIAKLLTGYTSGAGTVSSSDSILSAIQKLNGNAAVIDTKVGHLVTLSGVSSGADDLGTFTGSIIPDSSTVKAALQSVETFIEAMPSPMVYRGLWAASTNTPSLADGTGSNGDVYRVTDNGSVDFGNGAISFAAGDQVVYNGATSKWEKWDQTDAVSSVNGSTGSVTVNAINQLTGDVTATAASGSQSKATSVAAIQGTAVSGTTGSGNVVFSASPTFTGTIVAAAANFSGAISASNLSGSNTGDQTITLTGEATGSGTGSFAVTLTNSAVIGKVLTGYVSGAGTVSATDSILQAIQKLNGNIAAASGSAITSLTGEVTATGPGASSATVSNAAVIAKVLTGFSSGAGTVSASDSILSAINKLDGNIAGKQASGNYITALTGEGTASGPGSAALTLSNAAVIAKVLTGYSSGAGTVSATDSILQAIQKLNGNNALNLPLAGGTMSGVINMGSNKVTNVTDPTSAQDAATKNYVDNALAAFQPKEACYAASTANIVGTYNNGTSGVGATFTVTATGAFTIDGTTPPANSRILLKNQTSGLQNGVYDLTIAGSVGVSPVLTRSLNYNTAADINAGDLIPVVNGTANTITSWLQTATVTTVGTDSLTFTQYSANPASAPSFYRAGQQACSSASTSQAITFSSTLGTTNYAPTAVWKNTTDSTPQFQNIEITAKSATGFTVSWNAPLDSANYVLEFTAFPNV